MGIEPATSPPARPSPAAEWRRSFSTARIGTAEREAAIGAAGESERDGRPDRSTNARRHHHNRDCCVGHAHTNALLAFDAHIETKTVKDRKKRRNFPNVSSHVTHPTKTEKERRNNPKGKNVRFAFGSTGIVRTGSVGINPQGMCRSAATSAPNSRHVHSPSCHSADGENEPNCVAISAASFIFFLFLRGFSIYLFCYFVWFVRK